MYFYPYIKLPLCFSIKQKIPNNESSSFPSFHVHLFHQTCTTYNVFIMFWLMVKEDLKKMFLTQDLWWTHPWTHLTPCNADLWLSGAARLILSQQQLQTWPQLQFTFGFHTDFKSESPEWQMWGIPYPPFTFWDNAYVTQSNLFIFVANVVKTENVLHAAEGAHSVFVTREVPSSWEALSTDTYTFLTAQGTTCYGGCSQRCVKVSPDAHTGLCAARGAALI